MFSRGAHGEAVLLAGLIFFSFPIEKYAGYGTLAEQISPPTLDFKKCTVAAK